MKNYLIFSIFVLLSFNCVESLASTLHCNFDSVDGRGNDETVAVVDHLSTDNCNGGDYSVDVWGVGLGLRFNTDDSFEIKCSSRAEIDGSYYGIKADLEPLIFGADGAAFAGSRGVCVLYGLDSLSAGADVSLSRIVIKKN